MFIYFHILIAALSSYAFASRVCQPFRTTFPPSSVAGDSDNSPRSKFKAISPPGSYNTGDDGLELYLTKPAGVITTRKGVNNKIADGATVNSTFTILYGKVTFEVSGPVEPGVVTAVILIADERDEIDVELLGSDPSHWQTNVFAPGPPHYGSLSSVEKVPNGGSIHDIHSYSIDWTVERIIWAINGIPVRTLTSADTRKDGYPSHPARLQLGIWDASSPSGTSAWAKGPINWKNVPERMKAVVRSVTVEC